jgi:hypothetical protein
MSGEMRFKADVVKTLRSQGAMVYPMVAGLNVPSGWPDTLVVHRDWAGLIEFKGKKTSIKRIQLKIIFELSCTRPGSAWIVREAGNRLCDVSHVVRDVADGVANYSAFNVGTMHDSALLRFFKGDYR